MSELNSFTVGRYQPGAFMMMKYFLKNFPYENALFSPTFIGIISLSYNRLSQSVISCILQGQ